MNAVSLSEKKKLKIVHIIWPHLDCRKERKRKKEKKKWIGGGLRKVMEKEIFWFTEGDIF